MPRNKGKYVYITVALPLDSSIYYHLLEDAKDYGKDLSVIATMRIGNYYEISQAGMSVVAPQPAKEENTGPIDASLSNAAAANDAWPED